MITDPDEYFAKGCGRCARFAGPDCSTRRWLDGITTLRRICLAGGLTETAKWGHPVYMHGPRNIAIIGAFRDDFRLTFFNAALLADQAGLLERQGPNTRHADALRFADNTGPLAIEPAILSFIAEAIGHAKAGRLPPREPQDLDLPDELVEALDADPALAEAFHRLTPGRQRSHVIALAGAKAAATRIARIERLRPAILAGKGAQER